MIEVRPCAVCDRRTGFSCLSCDNTVSLCPRSACHTAHDLKLNHQVGERSFCVAWGPCATALGIKAIALGRDAYAQSGEIVMKLDGVDDPVVLKLPPEVHDEFRAQIAELMLYRAHFGEGPSSGLTS